MKANQETKCKCGCGNTFLKYDKKGRVRVFIVGHNPTKHSIASREKMRAKHIGMKPSNETRLKLKNAHLGKTPSEATRKKQSDAHKGAKSHLWKGGITEINQKIRTTLEYRLWREAVFKRDNYTCVWCFAKNGNGKTVVLNADHIKQFAHYPELRFAIDNGRTLCKSCHKKTNTYGNSSKNK